MVFLGKHKATNTFYALKYIAKNIIEETQGLDRIQQELNTLQRLNHPFIIKYGATLSRSRPCQAVL